MPQRISRVAVHGDAVSVRAQQAEAIILRSMRYSESDRILHLFTKERGRVGAIAKGVRKTRSRFGARLEPFAHVDLQLHVGRGELATVIGADLVRSHQSLALDTYRLGVGHIGLEAVLRLFAENDASPQAFHALARFLDILDRDGSVQAPSPALDALGLSFQLKLLWVAGYLPHLAGCATCGDEGPLVAFSAAAGGAVCTSCAGGGLPVSGEGFLAVRCLLERPLAQARSAGLATEPSRETLAVIESIYEYHGGFRMRTLRGSGG